MKLKFKQHQYSLTKSDTKYEQIKEMLLCDVMPVGLSYSGHSPPNKDLDMDDVQRGIFPSQCNQYTDNS